MLALNISVPAYAELTTELLTPNEIRISRNGVLLLVKGNTGENTWMEYVYFKEKPVLLRIGDPILCTQVFFENTPIKVAETDKNKDGHFDTIVLTEIDGHAQVIHDLLHIGKDGRLEPFTDEELNSSRSENENSQQAGPGYPPQGVGSPDP